MNNTLKGIIREVSRCQQHKKVDGCTQCLRQCMSLHAMMDTILELLPKTSVKDSAKIYNEIKKLKVRIEKIEHTHKTGGHIHLI